ncbi:hypothetical protein [Microvirga sesbaniae]|uniref:hypothetical protein n=1 Tax=Microvirga sesbaniae TaxID=681392 RepID=UPI0021C738B0|nr:hypothetical protein [Microvirga sp. HBU67692]
MNKPVFETVIGEKIDVGNVIDTTTGGAAAHSPISDRAPPVDDRTSHGKPLDLTQDDKDGRRSLDVAAPAAGQTTSHAAPAAHKPALAERDGVRTAPEAGDALAHGAQGRETAHAHDAADAPPAQASHPAASAGPSPHETGSATSAGHPSSLAPNSDEAPVTMLAGVYQTGRDDPDRPDNVDLRGTGFAWRYDLLAGNDTIWAGGSGDASIDGGAGNDYIYGRFFGIPDDGQIGDGYFGGGGFDTVDFSKALTTFNSPFMTFNGYRAEGFWTRVGGGSQNAWIGSDVEKIIGVDLGSSNSKAGDRFSIDAQYDTVQKSWYWLGMAGGDDLKAGLGNDSLDGGADGDGLQGGAGNDYLTGNGTTNNDDIVRDVLWGGSGDDRLEGGWGDVLIGDVGNDVLVGGWAFYGDYTYTSVTGTASFNFTYAGQAINRTVNLVVGTVTDGAYTDILQYVWQVTTGNGDDIFYANNNGNWLDGGGGSDRFYGGGGNDTLIGGAGYDFFYGSAGSDSIDGGAASGIVDYLSLTASVQVDLNAGSAVKSTGGTDTLANIVNVQGTNAADSIIGNGSANELKGGGGKDFIDGRGGNDTINGNAGDDSIAGGDEDDMLYGEDGNDTLDGGNGNDELHGWTDSDSLIGGAGIDKIYGEFGFDTLDGGADADTLDGGDNSDSLLGGAGNDSLVGGSDSGDDTLNGGIGVDTMAGGAGNDVYYVDDLNDVVVEIAAPGVDTIYTSVDWDLSKGGSVYVENLTAQPGNTAVRLTGNNAANVIIGNSGNNVIDGGRGADVMTGGLGNDTYYIDDLNDVPREFNGLVEGDDWAYISVKNFDARKLANIEHVQTIAGGTIDYAPNFSVESDTVVTINELTSPASGAIAHVIAMDDGNGGTIGYKLLSHGDKFQISSSGAISLRHAIDYETTAFEYLNGRAFLRVVVQATESETSISSDPFEVMVFVDDSNDAPTGIAYSGTLQVDEDALPGEVVSLRPTATDPDAADQFKDFRFALLDLQGNVLDSSAMFEIDPMTGVVRKANGTIPDITSPTEFKFLVRVTDMGGSGLSYITPQPITITVNPVPNRRPGAPELQTGQPQIEENTTGFVGRVLSHDDGNGGPIRYQIADGADKFSINDNGEITLTTKLDYETLDIDDQGNHYVFVEVQAYERDEGLESAVARIKVIVTNGNDAPNAPVFMGSSIAENAPGDAVVAQLQVPSTDPDGDPVSYIFAPNVPGANAGGRFWIDTDGSIKVVPGAVINYESGGEDPYLHNENGHRWYELWVVATDGSASSAPVKVVVEVTDANDRPADVTLTGNSILETAQAGATIGQLAAVDEDGDPVTYLFKLANGTTSTISQNGEFEITTDGRIIVHDPSKIQVADGYQYRDFACLIVASDGNGGETPLSISIRVDNYFPNNRTPSNLTFADGSVETHVTENVRGAILGTLKAMDDTEASFLVYALDSDPSDSFEVVRDEATGQYVLKLKDGVALDYEAGTSYKVSVKVTDPQGASTTQEFTIDVDDVYDLANHNPYSLTFDDNQLSAGVVEHKAGAVIGILLGKDEDANDAGLLTYHLIGDASSKFEIVDNVLKLKDTVQLDRAAQASYTVTVLVADGHGGHREQDFTINVLPENAGNQKPTNLTFNEPDNHSTETTIQENQRGIVVGHLIGTDADDAVNDLTYSIAPGGDSGGFFEVIGNVLKLRDGAVFDYDKLPDGHKYYDVVLRVTDPHGNVLDKIFRINIEDVTTDDPLNNDPTSLTFATGDEATVREHMKGALVGVLIGQDPDPNDAGKLTYELAYDPTGKFKVVGNELRLKENESLDVDDGTAYSVTVRVRDAHGGVLERTLTVNVIPENSVNHLPRISFNGDRFFSIKDNETTAPFKNIVLQDDEDDANPAAVMTVVVQWGQDGKFNVPDLNDPAYAGVQFTYTPGDSLMSIRGTSAQLQALMRALQFNPKDRPADANTPNAYKETDFTITLVDSNEESVQSHAFVGSTASGLANDEDDIYHIYIGNEITKPEGPDGGYDIAYVHTSFFQLNPDQAIEVLQVAEEVTGGVSLIGSLFSNTLIGGVGDDILWGVGGDPANPNHDVLRGGDGDDTYIIASTADLAAVIVEENGGASGIDTVMLTSGIAFDDQFNTYALTAANVESLNASSTTGAVTLIGNALDNLIHGNVSANTLMGGDGNDTLDGTEGVADRLEGGAGNDTYRVRNVNDVVVEGTGGGTDTVEVFGAEYHLGQTAQVEILKVGSITADVRLIGNAYSSTLIGGLGNDTLDGSLSGMGIRHTLNGGAGNDTYFIVNVGDEIDGELLGNNGSINGNDTAFLYRGLYANQDAIDAAIAHYKAQGVEAVTVLDGFPPDDGYNQLPVLKIADGTEVTNAKDNGLAVFLFRGVDLSDHEDDTLTLTVRFLAAAGDLADPSGTWQDGGVDGAGYRTYTWTGKADALDAILRKVTFNPKNDVAPASTEFTILVRDQDPLHAAVTDKVTVNTTHGDDSDNEKPVLKFAPGTEVTDAKDNGLAVYLLRGIDLSDKENDKLTVSISFDSEDGTLAFPSGVTALVSQSGGTITYTFSGFADELDAMLRKITFDPKNDVAPAVTQFTISVQDEKHAPVTGTVTVQTTHGDDSGSHDPTVVGLQATLSTPEDVPVALFGAIDIDDQDGDKLTAIITFAEGRGTLLGAGNDWSVVNGVRTYTFSGTADQLDALLKGFKFDPNAANEVTDIGLSVQDGNHPAVVKHIAVTSTPASGAMNIKFSDKFVREHLGVGRAIGNISVEGVQNQDDLVYTLVDNGGGRVELVGRQLIVKDNTKIDFEQIATGEFSFTISVSDGINPAVLKTFKLGVENIKSERVTGTANADVIKGGSGSDIFDGASGNDTLSGGTGQDVLTGGAGADAFRFETRLATTNVDRIQDFKVAENDRIELALSIFGALETVGMLSANAFVQGTQAKDANSRIIYDKAAAKLWYDQDGTGSKAAVLFATFQNTVSTPAPTLTHESFFVI